LSFVNAICFSKSPTYLVERLYLYEGRLAFLPRIFSDPVKLFIKDIVELLEFLTSFNELHSSLNDNGFVVCGGIVNVNHQGALFVLLKVSVLLCVVICGKVKEAIIKYKVNRSNVRITIVRSSYSAYFLVLEEPFLGFGKLYHRLLETALIILRSH
jgi:hypothetical protein